jgi:NAD(P)-dependent dehydrogenase (short-subunit alcohol dehydrogenase family)
MNILITGISGNLGRATARHLLANGHALVGSMAPGDQFDLDGATMFTADLMDEQGAAAFVDRAITTVGNVHCGVLLVGGFAGADIEDTPWSRMEAMIDLNFRTTWNVARPLYKHMINAGRGRLILTGAKPGLDLGTGTHAVAYALSKSLVFRLSELINSVGRKQGVDCAVIVPNVIDTPQNRTAMPNADFSTWLSPDSIAEVIGKLCARQNALEQPVIKLYA